MTTSRMSCRSRNQSVGSFSSSTAANGFSAVPGSPGASTGTESGCLPAGEGRRLGLGASVTSQSGWVKACSVASVQALQLICVRGRTEHKTCVCLDMLIGWRETYHVGIT